MIVKVAVEAGLFVGRSFQFPLPDTARILDVKKEIARRVSVPTGRVTVRSTETAGALSDDAELVNLCSLSNPSLCQLAVEILPPPEAEPGPGQQQLSSKQPESIIFVRGADNLTVSYSFSPTKTFGQLRNEVAKKKGERNKDSIKLLFNGVRVDDSDTFGGLWVKPGDIVDCLPALLYRSTSSATPPTIIVTNALGDRLDLPVDLTQPVDVVLQQCAAHWHWRACGVVLSYGGKILDPHKPLSDYGVCTRSIITAAGRVTGA